MKRLKLLRLSKELTMRELASLANVSASYISNAENRGMVLFPSQADRIADALGWKGDPADLFKEVESSEFSSV